MMLTSTASPDLVNISIPNAAIVAVLGYFVVFVGLILLMLVLIGMGKFFIARDKKLAAMIMAIVANKMGKPLNELRFISIKEVK